MEPGDGAGGSDLYLPEKWRTGNRLDWAEEDRRIKLFVGYKVSILEIEVNILYIITTRIPRKLYYISHHRLFIIK